jgi:hypothetical protein
LSVSWIQGGKCVFLRSSSTKKKSSTLSFFPRATSLTLLLSSSTVCAHSFSCFFQEMTTGEDARFAELCERIMQACKEMKAKLNTESAEEHWPQLFGVLQECTWGLSIEEYADIVVLAASQYIPCALLSFDLLTTWIGDHFVGFEDMNKDMTKQAMALVSACLESLLQNSMTLTIPQANEAHKVVCALGTYLLTWLQKARSCLGRRDATTRSGRGSQLTITCGAGASASAEASAGACNSGNLAAALSPAATLSLVFGVLAKVLSGNNAFRKSRSAEN